MSKIWRCPECETVNQDKKCVVCGYENPDFGNKNSTEQIESKVRQNEGENVYIQDSLKSQESSNSVSESKTKTFIKIIVATSAAAMLLVIMLLVNVVVQKNEKSEASIPTIMVTSTDTVFDSTDGSEINSVTDTKVTSAMSEVIDTSNITSITIFEDTTELLNLESSILCNEIKIAVNKQRNENNVSSLEYNNKADEIANEILMDLVADTYVKTTYMNYAYGKFDHMNLYYEKKFEFTQGIVESEAAEKLLNYEKENFGSKWLDERYDYIGSAVYDYGDGTWGIVFTLCYNDEVQTITTKAGIIIPNYRGLSVDEYTAELKRLGIPYQIIMDETDSVPEGYVVSIDGDIVGEYYNGIHVITVYEAFYPDEKIAYITINGKKYSTDLTELYLSSCDLTDNDIKNLKYMTNLTVLRLSYNQISDISELSGLTKLSYLDLSNNQISDISVINKMVNLNQLFLYDNQISDISALSNLTNLTRLFLGENQISDISALSNLTNLTELSLGGNQISDISALSNLTNLTDLRLNENHINNISALSNLANLSYLNLNVNKINNVSVLSNLINLKYLYLINNQISDITPLKKLTNLVCLYLHESGQISDNDKDLEELRTALPKCSIDGYEFSLEEPI